MSKKNTDNLKWLQNYEEAKKYYEKYGNLKVPYDYVTKNNIKLSKWLDTQKQKHKKGLLTNEQIELLNALKITWIKKTPEEREKHWQEMYALLINYYNAFQNIDINSLYKTTDGITYDANGQSLGTWLCYQRRCHKLNKLSSDKVELLNKLNITWDAKDDKQYPNNRQKWINYYRLAKEYYITNNHLHIPYYYKTVNGESLGIWLYTQKVNYLNKRLSVEQIKLLREIEWDFLKREDELKEICEKFNIDYEKNKSIIIHMTKEEIEIKINFLLINGYMITNEAGYLNLIFTMSDEDIYYNYGIDMENMRKFYYFTR